MGLIFYLRGDTMKETDLYEPVISLFPEGDIYPEVVVYIHRPDIVIHEDKGISVVEMKTSLSLALIEQAYNWVNRADYVYVAIPQAKRKLNDFAIRLLSSKGIGVIVVQGKHAMIYKTALKQSTNTVRWKDHLHECYKLNVSGGTNGTYMTPYKFMIQCVKEYLEKHKKSMTIKEIIKEVDKEYDNVVTEHYRNPNSSLRKALTEYETEWCVKGTRGKSLCFRSNVSMKK